MSLFSRRTFAIALGALSLGVALPSVASTCGREDLFRMEGLSSGVTKGSAPLYWDRPECNGLDAKCRSGVTLSTGQALIVVGRDGNRTCVASSSSNVGWVDSSLVTPAKPDSTASDVGGRWQDGPSELMVSQSGGKLSVAGHSSDEGHPAHLGQVKADLVLAGQQYAWSGTCSGRMERVGVFLVVADNHQCGGMNVNFDGIYRRK